MNVKMSTVKNPFNMENVRHVFPVMLDYGPSDLVGIETYHFSVTYLGVPITFASIHSILSLTAVIPKSQ